MSVVHGRKRKPRIGKRTVLNAELHLPGSNSHQKRMPALGPKKTMRKKKHKSSHHFLPG
jgi:hypothetical protein